MAPFFIPLDFAVPTPIMFSESFKTSPIITFIFAVPISRLTSTSLLFNERHLLIKHLIELHLKSDSIFNILFSNLIYYFIGLQRKNKIYRRSEERRVGKECRS